MVRDFLVVIASCWLALTFRFEGPIPSHYVEMMLAGAPLIGALVVALGLGRGLYVSVPLYTSLRDLLRLAGVVAITTLVVLWTGEAFRLFAGFRPIPLSVCIMQSLIMFVFLGALKIAPRAASSLRVDLTGNPDARRVLIVGAGDAGELVARDLLRHQSAEFVPVGFLDDDPAKIGRRIHGLTVFGPIVNMAEAAAATGATSVLIAMPSAASRLVREVVSRAAEAGLKSKIVPSLGELMGAPPRTEDIRDVDIADLIARSQVKVDVGQIVELFHGRTVLVTGAAGSIGSEVARQALNFKPAKLVLLDNNETDLFRLANRLAVQGELQDVAVEMVVADIRDRRRVDAVFAGHQPHLVFHAAAYKHVPVMEKHPEEAVITNVTGTRNVAEAAHLYRAHRFVLVSTDKAVNPTSVMGASKRVAEMLIELLDGVSDTAFASVRFGNVLASRGSVVPIFQEQIREGGPITVTHPEVSRYFMTIEEAASLIWQAGALAKGGETFVLEMGEPVRILDLAERMRTLLGNGRAGDIQIVITGLREGEKLHEDLFKGNENLVPVQPGILRTLEPAVRPGDRGLEDAIERLEHRAAARESAAEVTAALFALCGARPVPEPHRPAEEVACDTPAKETPSLRA